VLEELKQQTISTEELEKVKNKTETNIRFNDIGVLNKAMKIAYAAYFGDVNLVNEEADKYLAVETQDIMRVAQSYLNTNNCNILFYHAKNE